MSINTEPSEPLTTAGSHGLTLAELPDDFFNFDQREQHQSALVDRALKSIFDHYENDPTSTVDLIKKLEEQPLNPNQVNRLASLLENTQNVSLIKTILFILVDRDGLNDESFDTVKQFFVESEDSDVKVESEDSDVKYNAFLLLLTGKPSLIKDILQDFKYFEFIKDFIEELVKYDDQETLLDLLSQLSQLSRPIFSVDSYDLIVDHFPRESRVSTLAWSLLDKI